MKSIFDQVSARCCRNLARTYSTSFSLGIFFLDRNLRGPVNSIYAFVRLADEIVDSFQGYAQERLLMEFWTDTFRAIEEGISLNPVLHSFQATVNRYRIDHLLIEKFLDSMAMDLDRQMHDEESFSSYVRGSAEVVGLMCLWVFCDGDENAYRALEKPAMSLGSAFQKVNFLRDLSHDYNQLNRSYFPDLDLTDFTPEKKREIERDIHGELRIALDGIRRLPSNARFGVYVTYVYYRALLRKIEGRPGQLLLRQRLRLPNYQKFALLIQSFLRFKLGVL